MLIFSTSFVDKKINMVKTNLLAPPGFCGLFGYLGPFLGRHPGGPSLTAHAPQRHGCGVLAVLGGGSFAYLACGDPTDHNGGTDYVGGAPFAFRPLGE